MKALFDTGKYLKSQPLLTHAKRLADATDRVFVSLAEGVGRLGPWNQRRSPPPPRIATLQPNKVTPRSSPLCDPMGSGRSGWRHLETDGAQDVEHDHALEPAGVTPVLEALGRVMESHSDQGYAGVAEDRRFWALVRLLHALADRDSGLELTSASRVSGDEIHVEEDLSLLGVRDTSNNPEDHETNQQERAG